MSLATRFDISGIRPLAAAQYASSIRHIREQIIASTHGYSAECLLASMSLLSLYEVCPSMSEADHRHCADEQLTWRYTQILNADVIDCLNCIMHLRGVMAIMHSQLYFKSLPAGIGLLILSTKTFSEYSRHTRHTASTTIATRQSDTEIEEENPPYHPLGPNSIKPLSGRMVPIFDRVADLFRRTSLVLTPGSIRFASQLRPLRSEATTLKLAWASTMPAIARPVASKRFTQPSSLLFISCQELACPVLRADSYTDCK